MYDLVVHRYDHGVKIDPTGPVPPYLQVAADIRAQIRSGRLGPGSRITESQIVKDYEVARSTARRTLAALREEGLIYTVPQRGSYVLGDGNR
jgi:DNA-binding GntR family transcriptional regulator